MVTVGARLSLIRSDLFPRDFNSKVSAFSSFGEGEGIGEFGCSWMLVMSHLVHLLHTLVFSAINKVP
jgi:hypothetical protein